MIDVTVKTLDSQNHRYSVPDDITVQQFKDRIATSVSIPSDKQRLIYCGRVLQDDKNLSDYNVHEKVIHLVMRAPPQVSGRGNDSGSSNNDSGQIPHRGSHRSARAQGRHVLFGSIVVPEDAIEDLTATTTRGPSSSGVRLQQAKTMLDRASEVLDQLEEVFAINSPRPSTSSATPNDLSPDESLQPEHDEELVGATGIAGGSGADNASSTKKSSEGKKNLFDCSKKLQPPSSIPADELEGLYMEMDALNNMEPSMMGGTQVIPQMGSPLVGAITTSLAGGLAHAASAAFASALSSMNNGSSYVLSTPNSSANSSTAASTALASALSSMSNGSNLSPSAPNSTASTTTATTTANSQSNTTNNSSRTSSTPSSFESFLNSVRSAYSSSSTTTSNTPSTTSTTTTSASSNSTSSPTAGSQGNHPHNSVRGITVRITNRSQRPTGIRLEHPRCTVMVEVLDQYQEIQQRLQPFLTQYYRTLANDQTYENTNDRQLQADQYILWRVSSAMHFVSHAMHAISDIIIDLRRNPPRQLRARPIIIPQPAIVQAQINVAHNPDLVANSRNGSRSSGASAAERSSSGTASSATSGPSPPVSSSSSESAASAESGNIHRNLMDLDDGVVVMHVGPNGFTIDSISTENNNDDSNGNPPPELLQNLMSTLTSQLGMNLGGVIASAPPPNASTTSSSSSQSGPGGGRTTAPGHNSQATGNSGTNTTNATQTRVTPRPHVHVTPLHVPGMGMTQFDPFLPCQSHHIRPAARRRHLTTSQASANTASQPSETPQASNSTPVPANVTNLEPINSANIPSAFVDFLANLLANVFSANVNEGLSEEQLHQENMLAQLIRGIMAELCGGLESQQGDSVNGNQQQTTLHEFLEPFSDGHFFTDLAGDNFFAQLFIIVSRSMSLSDLVQLFFGDSQRLNQLQAPLRQFILEQVLGGVEPTETNINRAIDEIILDLDPHLAASTGGAMVNDGIDFLNTVHNFIRQRLYDVFQLILKPDETVSFGPILFTLLQCSFREFIAICLHCFSDGVQGLERLVESRVQSVMSGMRPAIQTWSVNTSLVQLRSMLSQLAITDDQIRHFIIRPDESRRIREGAQNQTTACPSSVAAAKDSNKLEEKKEKEMPEENGIEAMEVDDLGRVEEVSTTTESVPDGAVSNDEAPISVTIGSQPWHSAVPQDWIPVLTRDVERQRRGVPDTNLSDAYLYGMPLKRRKICSQRKPHGTVQQVMQDTLRQALRTSGVSRTLIESVSGEVSNQLGDSFVDHVRSSLKEQLENNQDFKPENFPKSDQKIRKN